MEGNRKEFMTLQAYPDSSFSQPLNGVDTYEVMINPDTFDKNMSVSYGDRKNAGYSIALGSFSSMSTVDYSFSLLLDGTGIVDPKRRDIKKELDSLSRVLFTKLDDGKGYTPNYVSIKYCGEEFRCRITSFKSNYLLFNPNGSPLRVKVTCSFSSACNIEPESTLGKDSLNDIVDKKTHDEVLKEAENLDCDSLFSCLAKL